MSFTLTDDPQFYSLEMALSNILMIGLFRSNNKISRKHVRDHTIMTSTWKPDGVLEFVTCLQILLF